MAIPGLADYMKGGGKNPEQKFKPRPPGSANAPVDKQPKKKGAFNSLHAHSTPGDDKPGDSEGGGDGKCETDPEMCEEMEKFFEPLEAKYPGLSKKLDDVENAPPDEREDELGELFDFMSGHAKADEGGDDGDDDADDQDDDEDDDDSGKGKSKNPYSDEDEDDDDGDA